MFKFSHAASMDEDFTAETWDNWEDEEHLTEDTVTEWPTCLLSWAFGKRWAETDKDSGAFSRSCFNMLPEHLALWFREEPSEALRLPHLYRYGENNSWSLLLCSVSIPAGCWMNEKELSYCHKLLKIEVTTYNKCRIFLKNNGSN